MIISRVISGAQTGADQGGLDAALYFNVPICGYAPFHKKTEDGPIPEKYLQRMIVLPEPEGYRERTLKNIAESDLTLVFIPRFGKYKIGAGTGLTIKHAAKAGKLFQVFLGAGGCPETEGCMPSACLASMQAIVDRHNYTDGLWINVAGPRESSYPGIHDMVYNYMVALLALDQWELE